MSPKSRYGVQIPALVLAFAAMCTITATGAETICYRTLHPSRSVSVTKSEFRSTPEINLYNSAPLGRTPVEQYIAKRLAAPRRGFEFLLSVKSYIQWRQRSAMVPGLSWRNQPDIVGTLSHALLIINTALSQDVCAELSINDEASGQSAPVDGSACGDASRKESGLSALRGRSDSANVAETGATLNVLPFVNPLERKPKMRQLLLSLIEQSRDGGVSYREFIHETKKQYVTHVLDANHWNQCKAARELGMHRNTMARTIAELGIELQPQRKPIGRVRETSYFAKEA